MSLQGIIFVVHLSIGGDKLVFRFPSVNRSTVSRETLTAFKQSTITKSAAPSLTDASPPSASLPPDSVGTSTESKDTRGKYAWYNTPSVVLAPILTPKTQLCDMPFDITIDDTRFIGHPSLIYSKEDEESANNKSQNEHNQSIDHHENNNTNNNNSNSNNQSNNGNGVAKGSREDGEKEREKGEEKRQVYPKDDLRLFNIVFTVPASTSSQRANRFKWMAAQIASALSHEQGRCKYLTEQVHMMSVIRDEWLLEQTHKAEAANKGKDHPLHDSGSHQDLTQRLLKVSRLACEIRDIYQSISTGSPNVAVRFNNWVTVPLTLQDPNAHSLLPLRPYHTILLLDSPSTSSSSPSAPHDAHIDRLPALKKLMDAAKPTKSFRELQTEIDIPLMQIYRMAAHLVFWGKAKVINIMTKNNLYILNPHNDQVNTNLQGLCREFSRSFPDFDLVEVLSNFSVSKPLGDHVQSLLQQHHRDFVLVVAWLLQKDLLVQLHTYIHLMVPKVRPESQYSHRLSYSAAPVPATYSYTAPYPSCPQPLQSDEVMYLEKLDDGSPTYQLLCKLAPYFRGRHHIEEIMWRENVSREQLNKLLKKHKEELVQVVHEGGNLNKEIMGIF